MTVVPSVSGAPESGQRDDSHWWKWDLEHKGQHKPHASLWGDKPKYSWEQPKAEAPKPAAALPPHGIKPGFYTHPSGQTMMVHPEGSIAIRQPGGHTTVIAGHKVDPAKLGTGWVHAGDYPPAKTPPAPPAPPKPIPALGPVWGKDRTAEYRGRDLHGEGVWATDPKKARYGTVIFDHQGRVLLREPKGHFSGMQWTLSKGHPDPGEHPVDTARRETLEETGMNPAIVGHVADSFHGSTGVDHYYVAHVDSSQNPEWLNGETDRLTWATPEQAEELMKMSTNPQGRERDLWALHAAVAEHARLYPSVSTPLPPRTQLTVAPSVAFPKSYSAPKPPAATGGGAPLTASGELPPAVAAYQQQQMLPKPPSTRAFTISVRTDAGTRDWSTWDLKNAGSATGGKAWKAAGAANFAKGRKAWGPRRAGWTDQDKAVVAKAHADAAALPKGKRFTGKRAMTDQEYQQHQQHIEHQLAAHGANDLMRSPYSTHISEDRVGGVDGVYTPEREALHRKIINEIMANAAEVPNERHAIVAAGLGGAGKSTTLRKHAAHPDSVASKLGIKYRDYDQEGNGVGEPTNFLTLNPDDIKEKLAEHGAVPEIDHLSPMEAAAFIHEEASHVTNQIAQRALAQGKNHIWDITLSSTKSGDVRVAPLRDHGYKVDGMMVDVSRDQSIKNALQRHKHGQEEYLQGSGHGGRYVPPQFMREAVDPQGEYRSANRRSFETLKAKGAFDHTVTIDNEGYQGKLIDESHHDHAAAGTRAAGDGSSLPIAEQIAAYKAGDLPWADLHDFLATYDYKTPSHYGEGHNELSIEDADRNEAGTWGEVATAHARGDLTDAEYDRVVRSIGTNLDDEPDAHLGHLDEGERGVLVLGRYDYVGVDTPDGMGLLETRAEEMFSANGKLNGWYKWHLAHPYVHKGIVHGEAPDSSGHTPGEEAWLAHRQEWKAKQASTEQAAKGNLPQGHYSAYEEGHRVGYGVGLKLAGNSDVAALDSKQISDKAAPLYAAAKKAKDSGDFEEHARLLGAAHGFKDASKERAAWEKAHGVQPHEDAPKKGVKVGKPAPVTPSVTTAGAGKKMVAGEDLEAGDMIVLPGHTTQVTKLDSVEHLSYGTMLHYTGTNGSGTASFAAGHLLNPGQQVERVVAAYKPPAPKTVQEHVDNAIHNQSFDYASHLYSAKSAGLQGSHTAAELEAKARENHALAQQAAESPDPNSSVVAAYHAAGNGYLQAAEEKAEQAAPPAKAPQTIGDYIAIANQTGTHDWNDEYDKASAAGGHDDNAAISAGGWHNLAASSWAHALELAKTGDPKNAAQVSKYSALASGYDEVATEKGWTGPKAVPENSSTYPQRTAPEVSAPAAPEAPDPNPFQPGTTSHTSFQRAYEEAIAHAQAVSMTAPVATHFAEQHDQLAKGAGGFTKATMMGSAAGYHAHAAAKSVQRPSAPQAASVAPAVKDSDFAGTLKAGDDLGGGYTATKVSNTPTANHKLISVVGPSGYESNHTFYEGGTVAQLKEAHDNKVAAVKAHHDATQAAIQALAEPAPQPPAEPSLDSPAFQLGKGDSAHGLHVDEVKLMPTVGKYLYKVTGPTGAQTQHVVAADTTIKQLKRMHESMTPAPAMPPVVEPPTPQTPSQHLASIGVIPQSMASPAGGNVPKTEADLAKLKAVSSGDTFSNGEKVPGTGTSGGQWYDDGQGGAYFLKGWKSDANSENEVAGSLAYQQAGVPVQPVTLVKMANGKLRALAHYQAGLKPVTPSSVTPEIQAEARKGFGMDALMSHYDVFGAPGDSSGRNLFKTADGKVVRLDLGGTGRFRAQGTPKKAQDWSEGDWDNAADGKASYDTLRDSEQGKLTYGAPTSEWAPDKVAELNDSLAQAANLDLDKYHQAMLDAGVSKKFADSQVAVLKARQAHLQQMLPAESLAKVADPAEQRQPEADDYDSTDDWDTANDTTPDMPRPPAYDSDYHAFFKGGVGMGYEQAKAGVANGKTPADIEKAIGDTKTFSQSPNFGGDKKAKYAGLSHGAALWLHEHQTGQDMSGVVDDIANSVNPVGAGAPPDDDEIPEKAHDVFGVDVTPSEAKQALDLYASWPGHAAGPGYHKGVGAGSIVDALAKVKGAGDDEWDHKAINAEVFSNVHQELVQVAESAPEAPEAAPAAPTPPAGAVVAITPHVTSQHTYMNAHALQPGDVVKGDVNSVTGKFSGSKYSKGRWKVTSVREAPAGTSTFKQVEVRFAKLDDNEQETGEKVRWVGPGHTYMPRLKYKGASEKSTTHYTSKYIYAAEPWPANTGVGKAPTYTNSPSGAPATGGPGSKKLTSVMAKNIKAGDRIIWNGQVHQVTKGWTVEWGGNNYLEATNVNTGTHVVLGTTSAPGQQIASNTKIQKLTPAHPLHNATPASATPAASAIPVVTPVQAAMQPPPQVTPSVAIPSVTAPPVKGSAQHKAEYDHAFDIASKADGANVTTTMIAEAQKAFQVAPPLSVEEAQLKGVYDGLQQAKHEWEKANVSGAQAKLDQEYVTNVGKAYEGHTQFRVDPSKGLPVPSQIPHGTKPHYATTQSSTAYDLAIAQGYDQAVAAFKSGATPEQIQAAVADTLDKAKAMGLPTNDKELIDQAHLAGLAQGAGKAAVDLALGNTDYPNASSKSLIQKFKAQQTTSSHASAFVGAYGGGGGASTQKTQNLGHSFSQAISAWKGEFVYSNPGPVCHALEKINKGQDPGNGDGAQKAKTIIDAYVNHGEPSKYGFQRKIKTQGGTAAFSKKYQQVGNTVKIPLTSWSTDPEKWSGDMWLHVPVGTKTLDIANTSGLSNEAETITGGQFIVKEVKKQGGVIHVYLAQATPYSPDKSTYASAGVANVSGKQMTDAELQSWIAMLAHDYGAQKAQT